MTVRSLLFGPGDAVRGHGRLVRTGAGDWFDPPLPVPLIGYAPGQEPVPTPSPYAVRAVGADFDDVLGRFERDGAVEGFATVRGVWLGDGIEIHRQTLESPEWRDPRWRTPPCPPPEGGWPVHGTNLPYGDAGDDTDVVSACIFWPTDERPVLVVAVTDVDAVRTRLGPRLGGSLCVVPSRWTTAQLDETQQHIAAMFRRWGVYGWGRTNDEQGQAVITADMLRVTDEFADWCDSLPAGLVVAEPCLTPVPHGGEGELHETGAPAGA